MRVLLTGAFGNIGRRTLDELLKRGHTVRCFDIPTPGNRKAAQARLRQYPDQIQLVWGDLRHPADVNAAVIDQDVVVHLAFIIPKMSATGIESEARPNLARDVNIGGTRNLIQALKALPNPPRFLFTSSYHVYGPTQAQTPPLTVLDPVHPVEHYTWHKVECERLIQASGLEWVIFRLSASLPFAIKLDPGMFDVPLDNRMEYVHSRDVALAIANAIESNKVWGRLLLIGGGPRCQYRFREIVERILNVVGVGMLPDAAFDVKPFPTDWLDTTVSQSLLHYQQRDLDDYIKEMKTALGFRTVLARFFRPIVRWWLLTKSPYYRQRDKRALSTELSVDNSLSSYVELTPELKALLTETALALKGRARRRFMARVVKMLGQDGQQVAERELGWAHKLIVAGMSDLDKQMA